VAAFGVQTAQAASGVVAGREATVAAPGGLNVRNDPNSSSDVLTVADDGDFVYVLAGPKVLGGEEWYSIEYDGSVGWVAGSFLGPPRDRSQVSSRSDRRGTVERNATWLPVPYFSQFDGTAYSRANCGPTSLSMALAAFGKDVSISDIRRSANRIQGTTGWYDAGVAIQVLADLAGANGLSVQGLYSGGGFDRWTFDEVRDALRHGHLVIPQVHLASLPGQEGSSRAVDHYIVITGFDGKTFYYNDPAFSGRAGAGLAISEDRLGLAWKRSDYPFAAFSVGPGYNMNPLIAPPQPAEPRQSTSALAAAQESASPSPVAAATAVPAPPPVLALPRPDAIEAARDGFAMSSQVVPEASPESTTVAPVEPIAVATQHADEGAFVPTWSGAVTQGELAPKFGDLPLSTGSNAPQLWSMVVGAFGLAAFGSRRQFRRLGLELRTSMRRLRSATAGSVASL
jgi:hypothetical protein